MATFDDVADVAIGLPEAEERERHGNRTWFVDSKAFAWERPFSKADIRRYGAEIPPDGPLLAVRVTDLEDKDLVLETNGKSFFTIPHFVGYAAVLIHLNSVDDEVLENAIVEAWLASAPPRLTRQFLSKHDSTGSKPEENAP